MLPAQQEKHSAGQALQGLYICMETVMQSFGMQAFCYVLYFAPLSLSKFKKKEKNFKSLGMKNYYFIMHFLEILNYSETNFF
jgi:hypothetical protein